MPRQSRTAPPDQSGQTGRGRTFRILLVDHDQRVSKQLSPCLGVDGMTMEFHEVASIDEARKQISRGPIDLAIIEANLPDGSGISLAKQMRNDQSSVTQTIVMTSQPTIKEAIDAIRSGAGDILIKPLNRQEVRERVQQAVSRWKSDQQTQRRIRRLQQSCKKLNQARDEVTQQVDILCNDLVTAYQELAQQFQNAVQTQEFSGLLKDELDIEQVLHRTLEYLLDKAGPTNAAIFLPANADEYTLAGYVNYDCTEEAAEVLWQYLADMVVPKIAQRSEPILTIDSQTLAQWIGDDSAYLTDRQIMAFTCLHDDDIFAVTVLFRDPDQPYPNNLVDMCTAIAPILGKILARVVRIHHRHMPGLDECGDPFI